MSQIPLSASPRILRSAFALKSGTDYLGWLRAPEQRAALTMAAEMGLPSVAGISKPFRARFGPGAGKDMVTRQFIGTVVKAIMREEGYEVADTGVKLTNDPVFSSGARYVKRPTEEGREADLLERFVKSLSRGELRRVIDLAQREFRSH